MKIAIVIASNRLIAKELLLVAEETVGHASNISAIAFHEGESLDELFNRYETTLHKLNVQNGVLFLIAGEHSCHQFIASQFVHKYSKSHIIIGVNLPMLVSLLLNEEDETDLQALSLKAKQYGKNAIHAAYVNTQAGGDEEASDNTI